jgi:hypothetical protein
LYSIDRTKKPQKIEMFLAKPNRTIIGKINIVQEVSQTIKFGQINSLSFSIPYEITINNMLTRNPIINLVREKFLVKVVFGKLVEWYVITQKKKIMDDSDSIALECFSLGYELKYKKLIDYKAVSLNCFQVLSECLKDTNWSIAYIHPDFYLQYRQFDVSSKTVLDFVEEVCETFGGIATYDTENRTISIWKEDELAVYKGFWIAYGKYLETIDETVSTDEIVTRLVVTPNENASINSANPTGQSYIDDFSYFLYPFERDVDRKVISSSYFMSDELCHALLDYNELVNENESKFKDYLNTRKSLDEQMTVLNNELQVLKTDLTAILDEIEVFKQSGESTTELITQRNSQQKTITSKENAINSLQSKIDINDSLINELNDLLKFDSNFTENLLAEINYYIQVEEWSDENQINDEDYYIAASEHMKTISVPPVNLTLNIINFFEILEEQHNWDRLGIGDIIRVKHPVLDINVKTKIVEITFNHEDGTISITISNTKRPESLQKKFQQAFYKINKLNTDYNKRKKNWESVATNFNTRNDRIKAIPNVPRSSKLTHKQNDDGSVDLTLSWSYSEYEKTNKDTDNIDGFMIHLYSSESDASYVFGASVAEETIIPVSSEKRTYTFPSIPSNHYYNVGIRAYRNVDDDITKEGVLFSPTVPLSPYLPNPQVLIKGNVNGKVNGLMHSVSETEPLNPETNDTWLDPITGKQKIYTGVGWQTTSAGDAETLSGVTAQFENTPNSIPVRDTNGIIQASITGDAQTLNGKSSTDFATVGSLSNITVAFTGSYVGDGTLSKEINLGFKPKLVRVFATNSTDSSVFIPTESGGFLMKSSTNLYIEGEGINKDLPSLKYGNISTNGFTTGNTVDAFINKLNVTYYWEVLK